MERNHWCTSRRWKSMSRDDVIKWKLFPRYRWIPLTKASDTGLWCFLLICVWTNHWANNTDTGNLRRHRTHYDVTVMQIGINGWNEWYISLRRGPKWNACCYYKQGCGVVKSISFAPLFYSLIVIKASVTLSHSYLTSVAACVTDVAAA